MGARIADSIKNASSLSPIAVRVAANERTGTFNAVCGVNRVTGDLRSRPRANIEWEQPWGTVPANPVRPSQCLYPACRGGRGEGTSKVSNRGNSPKHQGTSKIKISSWKQFTATLTSIYELIIVKLAELSPGVPPYDQRPPVPYVCRDMPRHPPQARAWLNPCNYPVLRLVSGLADGADQIAFQTLLDFQQQQNQSNSPGGRTWYEYVSVLPCDPQMYQRNSSISDNAAFGKLLARSDYVLELDGICDPSNDDDLLVDRRRMRQAFVIQSRMLLRQCDVLIAVPDLSKKGAAGGTRESITAAIDLGIPVILISLKGDSIDERISILNLKEDLDEDLGQLQLDWKKLPEHHARSAFWSIRGRIRRFSIRPMSRSAWHWRKKSMSCWTNISPQACRSAIIASGYGDGLSVRPGLRVRARARRRMRRWPVSTLIAAVPPI